MMGETRRELSTTIVWAVALVAAAGVSWGSGYAAGRHTGPPARPAQPTGALALDPHVEPAMIGPATERACMGLDAAGIAARSECMTPDQEARALMADLGESAPADWEAQWAAMPPARRRDWLAAARDLVAAQAAGTWLGGGPVYHVRRIIDGDTLEIVDAGGIRTRVRLRRLDAPELDEPGGPHARDALAERLGGQRVQVTPHARDRYGRLIADVEPLAE